MTELNGRTVSYGYDNLYRLTNETIASDPSGMNGAVSYTYDPVGNRTQKVSTIPGYPGGLTNYNANDQLTSDTYDANGNTTASNGLGYAYDFENHLVQAGGGISMVYDGRVAARLVAEDGFGCRILAVFARVRVLTSLSNIPV